MMMKINKRIVIGTSLLGLTLAAVYSVLASSPVFVPELQPVGYVGQPVPSNINVTDGKAKMYAIDYDARKWSGNLHSYPISTTGSVGATDEWGTGGASAKLAQQIKLDARYIVTYSGSAGIPFRWSSLPNSFKQAIDSDSASAASSSIMDYLRGDPVNEGTGSGKLRVRGYGLGDIIHSTPVYWNDGVNKTVFIGANDGMLHAFNAADGNERFAYVPASVIANLSDLSSRGYAHRYYVDGRMDIKKFGNRTVLVGTLGGGGKGIFGLDVTAAAPTSETDAAAKVLWEVNNKVAGFANLGDTYSAPSLATLPDGSNAVIVGNGYNNGTDSGGNGHAVLYLINAVTGALIKEFDTGSGSPGTPNGLSSPSLWDSDGDGVKDTAYAGDIDGNVWKFKLTAGYATAPVKLYTNGGDASQAITMAPGLMAHPLGGVMVEFVTGRQLTKADSAVTATHYAYGLWDGAPAANDTFLVQTLTEANYTSGTITTRVRTATAGTPNWTAGAGHHKGWRTALPIGGERVVGDGAYVTGSVFQFFSTNPTINPSAIPPGENWWMQLNPLTGGDTGLVLFDLNEDKTFGDLDKIFTGVQDLVGKAPVGRFMGGGIRSQLVALSADGVDVFQSNYDRNAAPPTPTTVVTHNDVGGDRGVSGGHFDTDVFCYTNCGKATSSYRMLDNPWGAAANGYEYNNGNAIDTQRYIHVHEYDDIFDRVGLNMLHPSQDLQRLTLTQATGTADITYLPLRPTTALRYPASSVIVGSPVVTTGYKTGNNASAPATTYTYSDPIETAVPGSFSMVTQGSNIVVTTKTKYTTDLTIAEAVDIGPVSNRKIPYSLKTTVRRWDTVVTTVVTSPNTSFKVLMSNQAYSPAVKFNIGGSDTPTRTNATFTDNVYKYQASSGLKVADLPSYKMATISELTFAMPLDAFNIKDWGTGVSRTGLHPVRPQCVGVAVGGPTLGPNNEWRNGALTVQIVDASVADSDIELNVPGSPKLGYHLKLGSLKTKLIAEYLIYWHHPSETCMGNTGWSSSPVQDKSVSDAIQGAYPAAENDPQGVFVAGSGTGTDVVMPPVPDPVIVIGADGTRTTTTVSYTPLAGGGYTETTTVRTDPPASSTAASGIVTGGQVDVNGNIGAGIPIKAGELGRINWRELQ
jgi:type IV pilus assembly protein PilY1